MDPTPSYDQIIALLTRTFASLEARALQESDLAELSMKQIVYLDSIARLEKPTFSDLAHEQRVSKPSVTAIVAKLAEKGLVQRVQSQEDRRSFFVLLTEKGRAMCAIHERLHQHIARHFAAALSESELRQLFQLLQKALSNLRI